VSEDDHGALLDARTRHVTVVLEAFYAEREWARAGDEPRSAPCSASLAGVERHHTVSAHSRCIL
jgi:hypothetical protein